MSALIPNLNAAYKREFAEMTAENSRVSLAAFRKACDNGSVEATAKAFRKLTIQEVCATVRQLLEDCDGDSSIHLQKCLERLEEDRIVIEEIMK